MWFWFCHCRIFWVQHGKVYHFISMTSVVSVRIANIYHFASDMLFLYSLPASLLVFRWLLWLCLIAFSGALKLNDVAFCLLGMCLFRDHFLCVSSQWETTLHCNVVSHWLGAYPKCSLLIIWFVYIPFQLSRQVCDLYNWEHSHKGNSTN